MLLLDVVGEGCFSSSGKSVIVRNLLTYNLYHSGYYRCGQWYCKAGTVVQVTQVLRGFAGGFILYRHIDVVILIGWSPHNILMFLTEKKVRAEDITHSAR